MALAFDPITGEDVEIGDCHPVHAARDADDLADGVVSILDRDFRHDPSEGCQGTYSLVVEADCPECGCNRAEKAVQTLGGVVVVACAACDHVHKRA